MEFYQATVDAVFPEKAHDTDAGYDLFSSENISIEKHGKALVNTGIIAIIPEGYYGRVASRSSLSVFHSVEVGAGVIDSGYRNEIKVLLYNHGAVNFHITKGDKIAQLVVEKIYVGEVETHDYAEYRKVQRNIQKMPSKSLGTEESKFVTSRGRDGFGSTGLSSVKTDQDTTSLEDELEAIEVQEEKPVEMIKPRRGRGGKK